MFRSHHAAAVDVSNLPHQTPLTWLEHVQHTVTVTITITITITNTIEISFHFVIHTQ
jgi:hypothetical protein